ncbi:SpaA isopeptide-forming pilin-related protein [Caryophanon latum]|uniref:Gram-positive cocci surface proteins LPxTG domain-containing protein n=1 Tax=Caryophanon latum TaxID=33977 RepID=A0A1C0YEB9_9BACL|nr:SpaA isopeptide-forming pilin-related protein [Caryophanon latum]OCS85485.1 hypothetical protein A6K76_15155 [Caryophanon latum]
MKKIMHICFAFVLVLSAILLTTGIGVPKVAAEGINGLTDIQISYSDAAGAAQTSITDETTRIKMNYNFKFTNTGSEGQVSEFKLPTNVFKMPNPATDQPLIHAGQNIGTYTIEADGTVTLKFKPNLQNVDAWFWFETWINPDYTFESNKQTITLENEHTLELEAAFSSIDGKYGKLESNPSRIKWSMYVNTELKNVSNATVTDALQQYLTFDPTTLKVHKLKVSEGGKLAYGAQVTNVQNSGSATNLSFNLGNISGAYIIEFETKIDPQAPSITFNNTALFNGKELKATPVKYENLIDLTKANKREPKNEVGANKTGNDLTISSGNKQNWEITFNNTNNRKTIPSNLEVQDKVDFSTYGQYSKRIRYVPNSMKVYRKGTTGDFEEVSFANNFEFKTAPNSTAEGAGAVEFILRYIGSPTTDAFKITYDTEDSSLDMYYSQANNEIRNSVQLHVTNNGERVRASESKSASYAYGRFGNKIFYKNVSNLDYENQKITTQFVVRVPEGNAKLINIFDWSGSRLLLSEVTKDNIKITKYTTGYIQSKVVGDGYTYYEILDKQDGETLTGEIVDVSKYHIKYETDANGIVSNKISYHLYPEGSTTPTESGLYVIEVETPFNADLDKERIEKYKEYDLHNNAYLREGGTYVGTASASHEFTNNPFMMQNGFKDATYDLQNRKITWEVGFNYNVRSLEGAVITDTIEGNHNFGLTTFTLKKWYVDVPFEGNKAGKEYTSGTEDIAVTEAEWKELIKSTETGFTLNMDDLIAKKGIDPMGRYILTYETKMKDDLIDKASYKNDFKINYVNDKEDLKESIITGTAEVPRGGEHVSKDGLTNGRNATWRLDVNAAQSTVDSIEIVDVLSANQVLNADSIEVFEATIDTDNKNVLVAGNPVTMGEGEKKYTYTIDGNTLNMTIHGVIDRPYIVTYKSFVLAANGEEINNSVDVDGKQIANLSTGTSELNKQAFALAGASATATGSVTVKKTASHTGEPLEGVVFNATFKADPQQPDMPGEQTYTVSAITDENGIATFSRLPYGEVEVYEAETIVGYILNSEPKTVTVGTEVQELAFENDPKINASVTLTKIDSFKKDLKLAGAEFKLQRKDTDGTYKNVNEKGDWLAAGATPITFTTSDQESMLGTIYLNELKLGDYQFVEVQAPIGYKFGTEQSYTFTLNADNTEETLTVENSKVCSAFEITVQQGGTPLADGTKIVLVDKDGTKIDGTIENGKASFTELPEGTYTVTSEDGTKTYGEVTVNYEEDCEEVVTYNPTCEKFDVIVKQGDQPLADGTKIVLVDKAGAKIDGTIENGKASFTELPEGTYTVTNEDGTKTYGEVTVNYEEDCEEVVTYNPTCEKFDVIVKQGDQPLADGTKVVLVDKDGAKIEGTIENGKASFTELPEGTYTVTSEDGTKTYGEVTVNYEEDCEEVVTYNPTCEKFDVIVKQGDQPLADGTKIVLVDKAGAKIDGTIENGKASFTELPEGNYTIKDEAGKTTYGEVTVSYAEDCEEIVDANPTCDMFEVIVKADGEFVANEEITIVSTTDETITFTVTTDENGKATFPKVTEGEYKVIGTNDVVYGTITVDETTCEEGVTVEGKTPGPVCEHKFIPVPELPEGSVVVIDGKEVPGTEIPMDTPPGTYPVKDEEGKDIGEIKVPETTEENPCPEGTFTPASPICEEAFIKVPELPEGSVVVIDGKEVPGAEIPMDTPPGTYPVKDEEGKDIGEITVPEKTKENPCPEGTFTPASNMCSDFEVTVTVDGNTLTPGTIVVLVNEDGVKFQESVDDAGIANFKQLAEGKYIVTNEAGDVTYTTEKLTVDYELGCKDTVSYESPKAEVCEQFTMNITEDGMPVAPGTLIVLTTDAGGRVAEFVGEDGKVVFKDLQNGTYTITNQTTGVTYDDPITVDRTVNCETTVTHISPPAPVCDKEFVPTPQLPPGSTITINGEKVPVDKIPLTTTPGNYTVTDDKDKEIGELTITPGTPENPCPVTTFTEKEPPTGSVILTKIDRADAQKALQGATFKLQIKQNGTYVDFGNVLTTNDNGQISAMDLPLGEYQFVEILAPAGYVLAAEPWTFAITEEQLSVIINAANDKEPLPPGQLAITKVDAETNAFLADAEFTLVSENNQESTKVTTGADGQVIITDLPVGNYTLTETKAPAGYVLDDKPIVVKISSGETFKVVVKNTQVPPPNGSLEVTKLEQGTNTLLVGAEFVVSNGSIEYKVGATNANGTSILNNLPPGEYTLTETKAPNGYVLDQQPVKFTIESDKTTRVTMYNVKQAGNFKLTKVDAATNARLAGAVFQISNGTTTIPFETNASGEAVVTNLAAGSYIVTEISPPSGYVLNSVPKVVTIEAGKTTELTFTNIAVVVPPPPVGTVEVTKIDATTKGALAGAEFTLYNDQQSYKVGPTNGSGIATVQNVQPGVYRLVEDKAPTGYVATNRETIVTVTANGTARVIVENTRAVVNGEFKIIKVDNANRSLRLAGAKFELSNGVTTITLETNANGEAIARNVEAGNYTVREIVAPTGYVLDPQVTTVQIRANEMTELTATNVAQQKVGTFMLVKVDATNASKRLAGAAFELSNGVNTYTLITNATGQATVANIPAGTYTLKEVIAPAGYRLNMELASVTIQDNATFTFTALNSPLPSGGNIGGGGDPNTDGSGNNNGGNPDPSSPTPGTGGNTGGGGNNSTPGTGGNTGGGGNTSTPGTGGNTGGGGNTSTPGTGGNTGGGGNTSTPGTGGNTGGGGNTSTPGTGGNTGGGTNSNITTGGGSSSTGGGSISTPNSGGSTTGTVTTTRPGTTTSSTAGGTTTYYPSTTTTTKPAVTTTALPSGTTTTTTTATLPQTNVQSTAMLTVAGALLVLIAAIVMYRRRKLS